MKRNDLVKKLFTASLAGFIFTAAMVLPSDVYAKGNSRNVSRTHVKDYNRGGRKSYDRSRDVNIKHKKDVNINVKKNVHVHGGYHGRPYYGRPHYDYHYHDRGVSTGAAVAIGLAGLAVGAMIASSQVPPSCSVVTVRGVPYQQCGSTWLQPQYVGSQVNYVVVNPPY